MADPNFPPNLDIRPLVSSQLNQDAGNQKDAITQYGIAGRIWEAAEPLIQYLTPSEQHNVDPPCPIFQHSTPRRIIELGSGQAVASLHLASLLYPYDMIVLTDLPNVVPLCEASIRRWTPKLSTHARVVAKPLPWGDGVAGVSELAPFTHILMCDLVYFPHLYPSLLHTLLALTEHRGDIEDGVTFGPPVILSYHSRTLALEESFFDALSRYFQLTPVRGLRWEARIFICRRWKVNDAWRLPEVQDVMSGGEGVIRGRDYGLIDELLGSIEWE